MQKLLRYTDKIRKDFNMSAASTEIFTSVNQPSIAVAVSDTVRDSAPVTQLSINTIPSATFVCVSSSHAASSVTVSSAGGVGIGTRVF